MSPLMGGPLYVAAFAVGSTLLLLVLAVALRREFAADLARGNDAQRIAAAGEMFGVFLLASATVQGSVRGESLAHDLLACAAFCAMSLAASTLAGRFGVRLLLRGLREEVLRGNKAAGLASAAQLLASALVTSRAIAGGDIRDAGVAVVFFVLGQATLLLFVTLFRTLTAYDDADQIHGENMAAAISYAGVTLAIALVVARALEGDFEGWAVSLRGYGGVLLALVSLWPVRQIFVQALLLRAPLRLRGGELDVAVGERRSVGLAVLEAASYVATAIAVWQLA